MYVNQVLSLYIACLKACYKLLIKLCDTNYDITITDNYIWLYGTIYMIGLVELLIQPLIYEVFVFVL